MGAFESIAHLDHGSPWRREKWQPAKMVEIGDYRLTPKDKRDRGDYADTIKLSKRTLSGLESHWRMLSSQHPEQLSEEAVRAVTFYSMFGGVRRQLRRLIGGYKKLYERKFKADWTGPDSERLPMIGGYKKSATTHE
jgi:hypothetical protein